MQAALAALTPLVANRATPGSPAAKCSTACGKVSPQVRGCPPGPAPSRGGRPTVANRKPSYSATGAAWKGAVPPELYWRDSEEDRYATEIAGDTASRKAARGGRREAPRLAAAWVAAAGYLEPPFDRVFQFFPGRPGVRQFRGHRAGSPYPPGDARQHRLHSDRRVSLRQHHRGTVSAVNHSLLFAELRRVRQWSASTGLSLGQSCAARRQRCTGVRARPHGSRRDCASMGIGRNLGIASAAHRIRYEHCGAGRPAGRLRGFGRLVVLCEIRFGSGAAEVGMAGGHGGRPGDRAVFEGERGGLAGPHAGIRPDLVRPHDVAPPRSGLRRAGTAVRGVFLSARPSAPAYGASPSPTIRWRMPASGQRGSRPSK